MTFEEVIARFEKYADIWNAKHEKIPIAIRTSILFQIYLTNSIDEGRFFRALDFREASMEVTGYRYLIDASRDKEVTYDDVLERGRKDGASYPGRFNYQRGIGATDFENIADSFANEAFRGF